MSTLAHAHRAFGGRTASPTAIVGCPDSRPPAYRAVAGLAAAGRLDRFVTGFYHGRDLPFSSVADKLIPGPSARLRSRLGRRRDAEIPADHVETFPLFDVALAIEGRLGHDRAAARHAVARWRTRRFDRELAGVLSRRRPDSALIFSDVGSEFALAACRRASIRSVLSVVHGDVDEEIEILDAEAERSPDFFPIYLGDGPVDRAELGWLHDRRRVDAEAADRILVPSAHVAERLIRRGTPAERIRVVPYAADTRRFRPIRDRPAGEGCVFLFAGGVTQRKGIKYLLQAWAIVRRPGWTLQILGALPADTSPLEPHRDGVEWLGRVGHSDVPAVMGGADVFAFPSLFEGSAVVTYEALAAGLPSIVTPNAGSVVRDGVEGFLVPPADVESLASRIERLGSDPDLRVEMSLAARARAESFDWARYQEGVLAALFDDRFAADRPGEEADR